MIIESWQSLLLKVTPWLLSALLIVSPDANDINTPTPILGAVKSTDHSRQVNLSLYALPPNVKTYESRLIIKEQKPTNFQSLKSYNEHWHQKIFKVLNAHHSSKVPHPYDLDLELDNIAAYFSQFPKVRALIESLEEGAWRLQYSEKSFETQVEGNQYFIHKIRVHFDPRSAAQFKFYRACTDKIPHCIASPADVLLHELIHLKTILNDPQAFIAEGGLDGIMYPFEHERRTIDEERALYVSMTQIDGKPRPLRNEHVGRHVLAACAICLQ